MSTMETAAMAMLEKAMPLLIDKLVSTQGAEIKEKVEYVFNFAKTFDERLQRIENVTVEILGMFYGGPSMAERMTTGQGLIFDQGPDSQEPLDVLIAKATAHDGSDSYFNGQPVPPDYRELELTGTDG